MPRVICLRYATIFRQHFFRHYRYYALRLYLSVSSDYFSFSRHFISAATFLLLILFHASSIDDSRHAAPR